MPTLKELTQENHRRAERTAFVAAMMKNQLTNQQWADYLIWKRDLLVILDRKLELKQSHLEFDRVQQFDSDIQETGVVPRELQSSQAYNEHIKNLDDRQAWAHVYVHYLGDLRGGQMLRRMVQLPMTHVDYTDKEAIESVIRAQVDESLADEANCAFVLTMAVMEEIMR